MQNSFPHSVLGEMFPKPEVEGVMVRNETDTSNKYLIRTYFGGLKSFYWTLTDGCDDCPWEKKGTGQIPLADKGDVAAGIHTCTEGIHHFLGRDSREARV